VDRERAVPGSGCILPAFMDKVGVVPEGREANLIVCYAPDLKQDVVVLLREAGYSDEEI
jgi:hypothetical protein